MNTIAVYPGSFDPITSGHLDIIERAAHVFDSLIVAVLTNPRKAPLLDVDTRLRVIHEALAATGLPPGRIQVARLAGSSQAANTRSRSTGSTRRTTSASPGASPAVMREAGPPAACP